MEKPKHADIERLKNDSGAGVFGALAASITGARRPPAVRFVRRGYVAGILDELNAFYARRPRPWRPASRSSCKPTHKERITAQRRAAEERARQIRVVEGDIIKTWRYADETDDLRNAKFHVDGEPLGGPHA